MTAAVLHQKLAEEAALAGYHDLFFIFAVFSLLSLIPVLFLRSGRGMAARDDGEKGRTGKQRHAQAPMRSPR